MSISRQLKLIALGDWASLNKRRLEGGASLKSYEEIDAEQDIHTISLNDDGSIPPGSMMVYAGDAPQGEYILAEQKDGRIYYSRGAKWVFNTKAKPNQPIGALERMIRLAKEEVV